MGWMSKRKVVLVFAVGLLVGVAVGLTLLEPLSAYYQEAKEKPASACPRYTVVHTEGTNLIVTDNQTNTLHYYTIDHDAEIGSELKLRGTVDLNKVGKAEITPQVLFKKKRKDM
jgi:hypothetical protein